MAVRLPRPHRDDVRIAVAGLLGGLLLWILGLFPRPPGDDGIVLWSPEWAALLPLVVMAGCELLRRTMPRTGLPIGVVMLTVDTITRGNVVTVVLFTDLVYAAVLYGTPASARRIPWITGLLTVLAAVVPVAVWQVPKAILIGVGVGVVGLGPAAPHSALTPYNGIPQKGFTSAEAIAKYKSLGVPAKKLMLGIGFYGRGWTGVTQSAPGGTATGAAPGTYEAGFEDYKVLKATCPATGTVGGTAYAHCGSDWWSYDTPATILGKMAWAKRQGLGGAFFWEFSGDTSNGELVKAINNGLR